MKVLMIYADKFGYTPTIKTLDFVPEITESKEYKDVQVAFIQVEKEDEEKIPLKKFTNFVKWLSRKNDFKTIILHSFGHLSESKADPKFTLEVLNIFEEKLKNSGFEVHQTPFGYFLDLDMKAPGYSLARVFKNL
ncbi:MAG TPA: hypothetical protein ENK91_02795 [Bacteroidetes bacterium]|nr:hypothetical protein [Bacteroidota bacterium]